MSSPTSGKLLFPHTLLANSLQACVKRLCHFVEVQRAEGGRVLRQRPAAYCMVERGHVVVQVEVESEAGAEAVEGVEGGGVARGVKVGQCLAHLQVEIRAEIPMESTSAWVGAR
jgi:hypothetical protein